jgi:hypothetical protein
VVVLVVEEAEQALQVLALLVVLHLLLDKAMLVVVQVETYVVHLAVVELVL